MPMLSVCVFCSAAEGIPGHYLKVAEHTGKAIAERGWTLVSGGERVSMMGAVARAARLAGGRTVGVVPDTLLARADRGCNELVITRSINERKAVMTARSDALLALPGGVGTCEEIFESWTSRTLDVHAKPLVVLDHQGHFADLVRWVDEMSRRGFISQKSRSVLVVANDIGDALAACAASAGQSVIPPSDARVPADPLESESCV